MLRVLLVGVDLGVKKALRPRWCLHTSTVVNRRAKDGHVGTACGTGVVDRAPGRAVARAACWALAAAVEWHALRPRPAHGGELAAGGRRRRQVPQLLLLPRQPRTQDRVDRGRAAARGGAGHSPGRTAAAGHRRHADQTLRAEG